MAAAGMVPTSPRLPSPPPPAEIQLGPKSPGLSATVSRQAEAQMEQSMLESAKRRIHPGTKAHLMAAGPPLVPLNELDSAFQLQEHLAALHYYHTSSNTQPITRSTAAQLATPPQGIDKTLWLYELCRFLIAQCNSLIVGFLFDTPPCSAATCPEMRASEWQFLCAVHDQPKSCCAIDYCCHTLDWAANVVTNPKIFPSRFVALSSSSSSGGGAGGAGGGGGAGAHDRNAAVKNLVNVFRRLHRIFAHAWFQHRGVFWSVEGQTGLYVFFKTVCDSFDLLPAENYKLPPEAEGLESAAASAESMDRGVGGVGVGGANGGGRREQPAGSNNSQTPTAAAAAAARGPPPPPEEDGLFPPGRTNTRRHIRSSPSTGSAVTTVMEADEDDGADVTSRMREMHISAPPETVEEEEPEVAEVPVIVEHEVVGRPEPEAAAAGGDAPAGRPPDAKDGVVEPSVSEPEQQQEAENSGPTGAEQSAEAPDAVGEPQVDGPAGPPEEEGEKAADKDEAEDHEAQGQDDADGLESTSAHDFAGEEAKESAESKEGKDAPATATAIAPATEETSKDEDEEAKEKETPAESS